ncbi:cytochrome P450 [Nocardia vinacea]|uniref:cytochrome P450 n=1 Tax=Nocardia vinacea TaxID=96468 RepID=UPI00030CBC8F|nr:cytochrome P450 [Nocardia vinacea]
MYHLDLENDERFGQDPFAAWDEVNSVGPLFYSTGARGYFVAADFETIKAVMQDPDTWSNSPTTITYTSEQIDMQIVPENMDPPVHTSYKRAVIPLLSPRVVATLEPLAVRLVNGLIDDVVANGECDFVKDFAVKLPSHFFLSWLGLGAAEYERMFELAQAATAMKSAADRKAVEEEIDGIIVDLLDARRKEPADDLATALVNLQVDGKPIERDKLISLGSFLFVGGQDTTSNVLGYAMWHLATHPDHQARLRANPVLIPQAIEEIIRYYVTVGPSGRTAKAKGELRGCPIEAGDRIFIARTAGDRAALGDFDLEREWNRHSGFGVGPHRCIGSHVARMELRVALEIWLERIDSFRLPDGFHPEFTFGSFQQNIKSLPLVLS